MDCGGGWALTTSTPARAEVAEAARAALDAGISIIPPKEDGTKAPSVPSWKLYQSERASAKQVEEWYGPRTGLGFVCGAVSGGLELLELDADFLAEFKATAEAVGLGPLLERIEAGYLERSPGGGWHLLYRCDEVRGNTKLAQGPGPTDPNTGRRTQEVLIETRGEGGYVVVAPSNGRVHPSGGRYELVSGDISTIATISAAERDQLWGLARTFDRMPVEENNGPLPPRFAGKASSARGEKCPRPGDDFNSRTSWDNILCPLGWTKLHTRSETTYWRRPGKERGISATTNHMGSGLLWVFSTSTEFDAGRSYDRFGVYVALEHAGDFSRATKGLGEEGYGSPKRARSGERSESDEWPLPRLGSMLPAIPFPDVVLPEPVANFVRTVADSVGCPVDFVALPALIVAGAAIGRSVSLQLKPGYFAQPALYGMNVGGPSSGKTPALDAAVRPMWEADKRMHDDFMRERQSFEQAETSKTKKNPKATRPVYRSAILDDVTKEVVVSHLAANPRGLLVSRDEGSAWGAGLNQYKSGGKGADRQFWLSALFFKPIRSDRNGHEDLIPIRVPHPFIGVVGNLTPEMLGVLREEQGRSDGFVERILFAFPDRRPRPYWSDEGIPEEARRSWAEIVERLRSRHMIADEDGKDHPKAIQFSKDAKAAWVEWYNDHVDEVNAPGFDEGELSVEGKLEDFAARLALILHLLHLAGDPTFDYLGPLPPSRSTRPPGLLRYGPTSASINGEPGGTCLGASRIRGPRPSSIGSGDTSENRSRSRNSATTSAGSAIGLTSPVKCCDGWQRVISSVWSRRLLVRPERGDRPPRRSMRSTHN